MTVFLSPPFLNPSIELSKALGCDFGSDVVLCVGGGAGAFFGSDPATFFGCGAVLACNGVFCFDAELFVGWGIFGFVTGCGGVVVRGTVGLLVGLVVGFEPEFVGCEEGAGLDSERLGLLDDRM